MALTKKLKLSVIDDRNPHSGRTLLLDNLVDDGEVISGTRELVDE